MGAFLGMIGVQDPTSTSWQSDVEPERLYTEMRRYFDLHNEELRQMEEVFIDGTTEAMQVLYQLPISGGQMQRRGARSEVGARRGPAEWTTGFPLHSYADALMRSTDDIAAMTAQELEMHIDSIRQNDINTRRFELLRALLNDDPWTFTDRRLGTVTVYPLANGDIEYPNFTGNSSAQVNNYIVAGYLPSAISDTNNPVEAADARLRAYLGLTGSNRNRASFFNSEDTAEVRGLADFVKVSDGFVQAGNADARIINVPENLPGEVIGRANGSWIVEWDHIPEAYSLHVDLNAPKPLRKRIPSADFRRNKGLQDGLSLVNTELQFPLEKMTWENWFGYGAANRLNGVVIQMKASGDYETPTDFAG